MTYPGADGPALENVSITLAPGRVVGLVGDNSAGKSTLIHLLADVLVPTAGSVERDYERLGWCSQRLMIDWFISTRLNIWLGARLAGLRGAEAWRAAEEAIGAVGLDGVDLDSTPEVLSGGQQQRLMIARVLAMRADLMLLDEPTVGLDASSVDRLTERLRAVVAQGATVLISSHDFVALEPLIDDVVVLDHGRVLYTGTAEGLSRAAAATDQWEVELAPGSLPAAFRPPASARLEGDVLLADAGDGGLAPLLDAVTEAGGVVVSVTRSAPRMADLLRAVALKEVDLG